DELAVEADPGDLLLTARVVEDGAGVGGGAVGGGDRGEHVGDGKGDRREADETEQGEEGAAGVKHQPGPPLLPRLDRRGFSLGTRLLLGDLGVVAGRIHTVVTHLPPVTYSLWRLPEGV